MLSDITVFADDHSPWTFFLEYRRTTVDSIPTYGRKRGLLSKGNIDGSYLILVKRYSTTSQTTTREVS